MSSKRKHSSSSSRADRTKRVKRQLMQQPIDRRRSMIESGKIRFSSRVVRGSNLKRIRANNCTVIGDNNHVEGDSNRIVGRNNTARGVQNTFESGRSSEVESDRQQTSSSAVAPTTSVVRTLADQITGVFARQEAPRPPPTTDAALTSIMPATGTDARSKHWKCCVLDLEGSAQPASSEELRCCICLENRFDTLFEPCHHLSCCRDCAKKLFSPDKPLLCPICKHKVLWSSIVF
jgi:hypothetical protein